MMDAISLEEQKLELSKVDLSCPICTDLLVQAVTTPCGHSFCKLCLELALSTKPFCPICRDPCPFPHLMHPSIALNAILVENYPAMQKRRMEEVSRSLKNVFRVVVGNRHERLQPTRTNPQNLHKWCMYVYMLDGTDKANRIPASQFIERVVFHLHPTFNPSVVQCVKEPYEVERIGWGTFGIKVQIVFVAKLSKPPMEVMHMLSFNAKDYYNQYSIQIGAL